MLRPETVDARQGNPEEEQLITPEAIRGRMNQILLSREMVFTSGTHSEEVHANGKYIIDKELVSFHGFPVAAFEVHWRTGERGPSDLVGILREWKIFGRVAQARVSLELIEFEDKEPDISIVNQDEKTRRDLKQVPRSEQEQIARIMKIYS
jgi:hypothetical protein